MTLGSALVILRLGALCLAPQALAQSATKTLEFEIASVRPANPDVRTSNVLLGTGESLTVVNVPLQKIIMYAYDMRDFQLAGGPGWIGVERYDIAAKTVTVDRPASEASAETDDQRKGRVTRVRERLGLCYRTGLVSVRTSNKGSELFCAFGLRRVGQSFQRLQILKEESARWMATSRVMAPHCRCSQHSSRWQQG